MTFREPDTRSDRDPCTRCGVRADVDCAHRPGRGQPPAFVDRLDRRHGPRPGAGNNFHRARQAAALAALKPGEPR